MKHNSIKSVLPILAIAFLAVTCGKWTETERIDVDKYFEDADSALALQHRNYLEALRAYKKTDHAVSFGWFGGWTGDTKTPSRCLYNLPDSTDLVSIWGGWHTLDDLRKADLEKTRKDKGLRAMICFIVSDVGVQLTPSGVTAAEFWGYDMGSDGRPVYGEKFEEAIRKYARAICDTVAKYNYDGFDFDYEPNYGARGNIAGVPEHEKIFVEELGKKLGPKSGTEKLLVLDGEVWTMPAELCDYFDYFIEQAYSATSYTSLKSRYDRMIRHYRDVQDVTTLTRKYILTENFEAYGLTGGVNYTDQNGNKMLSLEGMARFLPEGQERKGGIGTYHMEKEHEINGVNYPFLRKAIQIQNPSNHK